MVLAPLQVAVLVAHGAVCEFKGSRKGSACAFNMAPRFRMGAALSGSVAAASTASASHENPLI